VSADIHERGAGLAGHLRWSVGVALWLGLVLGVEAAALKTRNVFLITTDGLRWQEVFTGAEEQLMSKAHGGVVNTNKLRAEFWRETPEDRRAALLPFIWGTVAKQGQIYGNQAKGSVAHVTNGRNFSYPGYNEFLTGVADPRIDSNDKKLNANTNVFEWLNAKPAYAGKVAAVVNWDVIPWILNAERSRLPIWSGYPLPTNAPVAKMVSPQLEQLLRDTTPLWDVMILDSFTFHAAHDYLRRERPRAMYIAFGETDEWAHEGRYDHYLRSARHVDRFVETLWETAQSLPQYRDQTTFIITTDHGRGTDNVSWKNHGQAVKGSGSIWLAVLGPDTPPLGERTNCATVTQSQVAATVAAFLGEDFNAFNPATGKVIGEAIRR
jgi:hypothetical protein